MIEIDCIGLSCPIAIATHSCEPLLVKVDAETAREHVTRMAQDRGYAVKATRMGDETHLELVPKK
jgi:TusA-related sulfurtransferase